MTDTTRPTPLSELLAAMTPVEDGFESRVPSDWLQGRAIYGGLSSALCLEAARRHVDDPPPLRSAQVTFIGPAGDTVRIVPTIARRGKSATFVTVDMHGDKGLATRATFCFGAARQSRLADSDLPAPAVDAPEQGERFFEDEEGRNRGPEFAQHFNARRVGGAAPMSAADTAEFLAWMQHKDSDIDPVTTGLVALADALPPAALARFAEPAPISSMTWMFDMLDADPQTEDGWWLCRSTADVTRDGYSSQAMTIWNRAGEPIMAGRQSIAVFY